MRPDFSRVRAWTSLAIVLLASLSVAGVASARNRPSRTVRSDPPPTYTMFLPAVLNTHPIVPILLTPPDGEVASEVTLSWYHYPGAGTWLRVMRPEITIDIGTFGPVLFTDGGTWTWTVRWGPVNSLDTWATPRTFTIPVQPASQRPTIVSPSSGTVFHTGRPDVAWTPSLHNGRPYTYTDTYDIQVDDDPAFGSPDLDGSGLTGGTHKLMWLDYTTSRGFPFYAFAPYGTWHFRVRSVSLDGATSAWSDGRQFVVEPPYIDCKLIGSGPATFSVGGGPSDPNAPHITRGDISEIDPGVGGAQMLTIYVTVNSPGTTPIDTVDVILVTDSGEATPVTFSLTSGTAFNGQWTGAWTMPGTYCYDYGFSMRVANAVGEDITTLLLRNN